MSDERELYEAPDLRRELTHEEQKVRLRAARRMLQGDAPDDLQEERRVST
jgi:hypothetical protein